MTTRALDTSGTDRHSSSLAVRRPRRVWTGAVRQARGGIMSSLSTAAGGITNERVWLLDSYLKIKIL